MPDTGHIDTVVIHGRSSECAATFIGINGSAIAFLLMVFGYFGFRLSSQGLMTSASRNLLLRRFARAAYGHSIRKTAIGLGARALTLRRV